MNIFYLFLILLTVITLVGHGIWVFWAFVFRSIFGEKRKKTPETSNPVEDRRMSLFWAIHHIKTLANEGRVDHDAAEKVIDALCAKQSGVPVETMSSPEPEPPLDPSPASPAPQKPAPPPEPAQTPPPLPTRPPKDTVPAFLPTPTLSPEVISRPAPAASPAPAPQPSPLPTPYRAPFRPPPKRWQDIFAAFLEESNIRWGELVGGLLILFCSGALVVSFWEHIHELWFLQVGLFTGITAALFGAGLYAQRKWRLPNTSMGLLCIATLLTLLSFLLISAFGRDRELFALQSLLAE
ncbi:MAG: hypothetical protein JJU29_08955 [Verrucomicrobia bacterium]|nr:hypothetical protein [Verrucomicrobiota bacterium]MCH8511399.1 hypothetical protein [Kiritimatiellia bacterium]